MKKIIINSGFLCLIVVLAFTLFGQGQQYAGKPSVFVATNLNFDNENKIYDTTTIDDDFSDDVILVVLNGQASFRSKNYTPKDFEGIGIRKVHELSKTKIKQARKEISKGRLLKESVDYTKLRSILKLELKEPGKENVLSAVKLLEKRDDVLSASPNGFMEITSSSYHDDQWAIPKMQVPAAWSIDEGSNSVNVGVVDTGIMSSHDGLKNHVNKQLSKNFTGGSQYDGDHGTHVAGIIGAQRVNGNSGISGVARKVGLVSLNVSTDSRHVSFDAVIEAIEYATETMLSGNNPQDMIPILNLSVVTSDDRLDLFQAIQGYPGLVVAAAGNDDNNNDGSFKRYPASYDLPNIISVGASNKNDKRWVGEVEGSNWGVTTVDLFAPGTDIYSTVPASLINLWSGYYHMTGTSMAAPQVAGVAALIKSMYPNVTPAQIKAAIIDGVDKVQALNGLCVSGGRLNAYKTLKSVATFITSASTDGKVTITGITPAMSAITGAIEIPSKINGSPVTTIGESAFSRANCAVVDIPSSVTSIGLYAFNSCTNLVRVNLPTDSQLMYIDYGAFWNCNNLSSIIIPNSVTSIGSHAFYGSGLTHIDFIEGSQLVKIGDNTFDNCTSLTNIIIPSNVNSIGRNAFRSCSSLTSIVIPSNVRTIDSNAFRNCSELTSVIFERESQLTQICSEAFYNCSNLTSVTIPNSVTYISINAFSSCINLITVCIERPSSMGITDLGSNAFYDCPNLTHIFVPDSTSVTAYGNAANWLTYKSLIMEESQGQEDDRMKINVVETGENTAGQAYLAFTDGFELSNFVGAWGGITLNIELSSTEILTFMFECNSIGGLDLRYYATTTPDMPAFDVDRVYVEGNELIVFERSGRVFQYGIVGATQISTWFYGEISATFASKMICADRMFLSKPIDLMLENMELEFYPSWSESNTLIIELSNGMKIEVHTRPWMMSNSIDIEVYKWFCGEWLFVGLAFQVEGGNIFDGLKDYINIQKSGEQLLFNCYVDGGADRITFAVDLSFSESLIRARVSVDDGSVYASGVIVNDSLQCTLTLLGLDGEILEVLELPIYSKIDWTVFMPYTPTGTRLVHIIVVSGDHYHYDYYDINQSSYVLITQDTVWCMSVEDCV